MWARVFLLTNLVIAGLSGCTFGESDDPGCQSDSECGVDRVCRGGACFRIVGDVDAGSIDDDAG